MRLWTFQHNDAVDYLQQNGHLHVAWEHITWPFGKTAYNWMIRQMARRGIDCAGRPPVWAFHSCNEWGMAPTIGEAVSLMGDTYQSSVIEMEVPDHLVLLSDYGEWNHLLDLEELDWSSLRRWKLFRVSPERMQPWSTIQACMPSIQADWVLDIRPIPGYNYLNELPEHQFGELV